ncbi:MAG: TonB-dependent receptor plug domain-containing protein, partial [Methylibium sp.]|nr:TonB-dependent receptor plug domain-containing protein [Methylibium sp.]
MSLNRLPSLPLSRLTLALGAACLPLIVQAQAAALPASGASAPATLPEVRVKSSADEETATSPALGYRAKRAATATKSDTPLIETPQSVTVVTRERIEDLGAQGLQDALNYAAGVRSDAFGLDSRTDSVLVRGAYPDIYLDGLRQTFNYYTSTTRTDPYMLERIEVLRGPAAMLYGQGSTAGIVNMVSKRPLAETQREIGLQVGTFNRKQVQADFTGALTEDGQWLYRLVALARDSDTQVDFVDDDRLLFAPSLTWRPDADTSLTLLARWQEDRSGSTLQFFPWSGSVTPNPNGRIPNSRFIGEPGFDRYDSDRQSLGWLFEHRFSEQWTVRQNLRVADNEVDYRTLYADSFSNPGNSFLDADQRIVGRYAQSTLTKVRMVTADQHLEGRLQTGPVSHNLIVGVDALRFKQSGRSAFDSPRDLPGGSGTV